MINNEKITGLRCFSLFICSMSVCGFSYFAWNVAQLSLFVKWVISLGAVGMCIIFIIKMVEWIKIKG